MQVPSLEMDAAITAARNLPDVKMVLCSGNPSEITRFLNEVERENVYAELSWIKGPLNATEDLVQKVGSQQLLFGSHLPFLMAQTALAKVREAFISDEQKADILYRNAERVLG
jgi:predicted TIM-barrel fold metal-dependent hydrolase